MWSLSFLLHCITFVSKGKSHLLSKSAIFMPKFLCFCYKVGDLLTIRCFQSAPEDCHVIVEDVTTGIP